MTYEGIAIDVRCDHCNHLFLSHNRGETKCTVVNCLCKQFIIPMKLIEHAEESSEEWAFTERDVVWFVYMRWICLI